MNFIVGDLVLIHMNNKHYSSGQFILVSLQNIFLELTKRSVPIVSVLTIKTKYGHIKCIKST